jgi:hypothetical protein
MYELEAITASSYVVSLVWPSLQPSAINASALTADIKHPNPTSSLISLQQLALGKDRRRRDEQGT